jgi:hypothetical protein
LTFDVLMLVTVIVEIVWLAALTGAVVTHVRNQRR